MSPLPPLPLSLSPMPHTPCPMPKLNLSTPCMRGIKGQYVAIWPSQGE
jgi:hypothetical protein